MLRRVLRSVRFLFPLDPCLRSFSGLIFILSGNWGVGLEAGSRYGYKLLFVILMAGFFAVILQVFFLHCHLTLPTAYHPPLVKCLACRLGVVTGLGQLVSFRMIFYPRPLTLANRSCISLSTPLLQSGETYHALAMAHLISTLCLFGNCYHQYRFGRTHRIGDCS